MLVFIIWYLKFTQRKLTGIKEFRMKEINAQIENKFFNLRKLTLSAKDSPLMMLMIFCPTYMK